MQCGAYRRDEAVGATTLEWITFDTKTKISYQVGIALSGPTNWTFRWWVKF